MTKNIYTCDKCGKTFSKFLSMCSHKSAHANKILSSDFQKGKNNSQFGTIWITNFKTQECKKIKSSDLLSYENQGWLKKRVKDFSLYDLTTGKLLKKPTKSIKRKSITNFHIRSKYIREAIENILNTDEMTEESLMKLKETLNYMISELNMSPNDIKKKYDLSVVNPTDMFKNTLKIKIKSLKKAVNNYFIQNNMNLTDEKELYWKRCAFQFDPFVEPNIVGYDLLFTHSFTKSKSGYDPYALHRDHMISIFYGWKNNIPAEIISHPANCHIMTARENISKNNSISISVQDLKDRIANWGSSNLVDMKLNIISQPLSKSHRDNISMTLTGRKYYNDGIRNFFIYPDKGETPEIHWTPGFVKNQ